MHLQQSAGLSAFVAESNRIEGILRDPTLVDLLAHDRFLELPRLKVAAVEAFVDTVARARLRRHVGQDVRVGGHVAPRGGPDIEPALGQLLELANGGAHPHDVHVRYELLHPFHDGNGRSGRAIWLWQMLHQVADPHVFARGFLHSFYYQTLSAARAPL